MRRFLGWSAGLVLVVVGATGCADTGDGVLEQGVHGPGGELAAADASTEDTVAAAVDAAPVVPSAPVDVTTCPGWRTFMGVRDLVLEVPGGLEHSVDPILDTGLVMEHWIGSSGYVGYAVSDLPVQFGDARSSAERLQAAIDGMASDEGVTVVSSALGEWDGTPVIDAELVVTSDDGPERVRFVRYIDLPTARVIEIQVLALRDYRDRALATQTRMTGTLAFSDPTVTSETCALEPAEDATTLTDVEGVSVSMPGRTVPHRLTLDGEQFHYWTAGQDGLSARVGAWTILDGDDRSRDERLADIALLFTGADTTVVSSQTTEWHGSPAVDLEVTFAGGASLVLSRAIELPDGRVLLLQTDALVATRDAAVAAQQALVDSLVLVE